MLRKLSRSTPRKFRNKPERGFDSRKERRLFDQYSAMQAASEPRYRVVKLERQVRFELLPAQYDPAGALIEKAVSYVADFVVAYADGHVEVIDAKSPVTRRLPAYVIKRKLMLWRHGVRVREE